MSEAIDRLYNYEANKQALESIPKEIERLKSAYTRIRSAATDGTAVYGGGSTREDDMLSNIVFREELKRRLKEARLWVSTVDNALAVLEDEERLVLEHMYIHRSKGAVSRICDALGLQDDRSVYKRKNKALKHFMIALYGSVGI